MEQHGEASSGRWSEYLRLSDQSRSVAQATGFWRDRATEHDFRSWSYLDRKPQDVLLFFVFSTTADEAEFSKKLKAENLRFGDRGLHSINVQQDNVDLDLNQRWDSSGNEDNSSFNPFKRPPQRCRQ